MSDKKIPPQNELELQVWTQFLAAGIGGIMAHDPQKFAGMAPKAAALADSALEEYRLRWQRMRGEDV